MVDFDRDDVDLAIRYGRGRWSELQADRLSGARVFPVCSPALRVGPLPCAIRPTCAGRRCCTRTATPAGATGCRPPAPGRSTRAVGRGSTARIWPWRPRPPAKGVALADDALAAADLADGRLVRLFEVEIATNQGYWLIGTSDSAGRPKIVPRLAAGRGGGAA